jgi:DNA-binding transcriptional MerR regulator
MNTDYSKIRRLYFSISEVSRITGLKQYVLRYWETEFEGLKPDKNRAGNRIYTNGDIIFILHIKQLLRDEKYTIRGAKQQLAISEIELNKQGNQSAPPK